MCTTDTNPCLPSSLSTHISTGGVVGGGGGVGGCCCQPPSQPFESFLSHLGLLGDEQGCGLPYTGLFRGEWDLAASELSVLRALGPPCKVSLPRLSTPGSPIP